MYYLHVQLYINGMIQCIVMLINSSVLLIPSAVLHYDYKLIVSTYMYTSEQIYSHTSGAFRVSTIMFTIYGIVYIIYIHTPTPKQYTQHTHTDNPRMRGDWKYYQHIQVCCSCVSRIDQWYRLGQ